MTLKTLKDFAWKNEKPTGKTDVECRIFEARVLENGMLRNELREEAKKWIVHYGKQLEPKTCNCGKSLNEYEIDEANYKIEWIKHFFNITEEELK